MQWIKRKILNTWGRLVASLKKFVLFQIKGQPQCQLKFYADNTNVPITKAAGRPEAYRMLLSQGALQISLEHPSGYLTLEGARALQYLQEAGVLHRILEDVAQATYTTREKTNLVRAEVDSDAEVVSMFITTVVPVNHQ